MRCVWSSCDDAAYRPCLRRARIRRRHKSARRPLWPRGIAKADAPFDIWLKEIAPSTELRHWYNHQPEHYAEFIKRYRRELEEPGPKEALGELRKLAKAGPVTLLTATKELELSHLSMLAELVGGSHARKA